MKKENKREQLIARLQEINNEKTEINEMLRSIDINETIEANSKFIGKYYSQIPNKQCSFEDHITCIYVYGLDNRNKDPMSLEISYWIGEREISFFSIEYTSSFNPNCTYNDYKWKEISKKEFYEHLDYVKKLIDLSLNNVTEFKNK